jgi:predicted ArsR family transcriptional regulator
LYKCKEPSEVERVLCELRGTSKLNELEKQASSAIANICGRVGMETSKNLSDVLQYIAQNGYLPEDKPLLQEIVTRRYIRGVRA